MAEPNCKYCGLPASSNGCDSCAECLAVRLDMQRLSDTRLRGYHFNAPDGRTKRIVDATDVELDELARGGLQVTVGLDRLQWQAAIEVIRRKQRPSPPPKPDTPLDLATLRATLDQGDPFDG